MKYNQIQNEVEIIFEESSVVYYVFNTNYIFVKEKNKVAI